MQVCSGALGLHTREDVCKEGESVQCMAVNPNGTILAVVTQLRLHFWSAGPTVAYLTSLTVPDTSLDDDPAMFVLWRMRQGNHLAVVTARRVTFFEADINLRPADFLQAVEQQRRALYLHHIDSAARVCYSSHISIETGIVTSATPAGPYAFLVTTTAGVVYVVGWHQQEVLHQWTTVSLQAGDHAFRCCTQEEGPDADQAAASLRRRSFASTSPTSMSISMSMAASSAAAAARGPRASLMSGSLSTRVDPLQRRYQQDAGPPPPPAAAAPARTAASASFLANSSSSPLQIASTLLTGPAKFVDPTPAPAIRAPGAAVRSTPTPSEPNDGTTPAAAEAPPDGTADAAPPPPRTESTHVPAPDAPPMRTRHTSASLESVSAAEAAGAPAAAAAALADAARQPARPRGGSAGAELLSGTILHTSFASRWKVMSFVFSSGSVLLCRPSCGTNFTHQRVQLQGCVTPIVSASMVAINVRHLLLAVCTQAGAVSCRRIDGTTLAVLPKPLWKGLRGVGETGATMATAALSTSQSLGLISGMEWSPSEELLCVAFCRHGVALVHYGGGVVARHLADPASATLLRCPPPPPLSAATASPPVAAALGGAARMAPLGCSAISWKADGTRLWMAAPGQACFFSVQLSRVLTVDTVGPTHGRHAPLALLADNGLYLVSLSEAAATPGARELVLLPDEYLGDQYPLLYGAVSSDGSWMTCAGRRGLVLFNRDRYSWKLASKKQEEESFSCVADPVWLRDVAVAVPALRTESRTYELLVFSTSSVSPCNASARVALDGRPAQLSCVHQDHRGEGYIVVVDCNQVVRVFRYDIFTDVASGDAAAALAKPYVALSPVQQLVLPSELASPLSVIPVCLRSEDDDRASPQRAQDQVELRLLLHKRTDHSLVWVRGGRGGPAAGASTAAATVTARTPPPPTNGHLPLVDAVAEAVDPASGGFVFHCWVDRTAPVRGAVLLTHEEQQGLVLYQLQPPPRDFTAAATPATHRLEVAATRDSELLPICPSPFDGYMLCIATDTSAPRPGRRGSAAFASPRPLLALRPVLYAHRILSLLLLAAMPPGGPGNVSPTLAATTPPASVAAPLPPLLASSSPPSPPVAVEVDGRVATFLWDGAFFHWLERMRLNDTFAAVLDYFVHTALNESPPAAVPGLGRRSAVRAAISLLRNYPEFYAIVVGCVRKIDFTRWHLVLDFLGTPTDLFHECVAHHCYAEAVHLVRVIMMGSYKPVAALSVDRVAALSSSGNGHGNGTRQRAGGDVTSLQQASECAVELFVLSVENGDYTAAYDIMRFMALLEEEIGMPAAGGLDLLEGAAGHGGPAAGGGTSDSFLTRWLRQLTFSGAAYDDPEAAVDEPVTTSPAAGAPGAPSTRDGARVAHKSSNGGTAGGGPATAEAMVGYPTLVFDAARCAPRTGGLGTEEAAEEAQRQSAVHHMFCRHKALPKVVHLEALRLLRTGYVTQLARLMETFSFSVVRFLYAARALLMTPDAADVDAAGGDVAARLYEIFDGLHKELGLPRSFAANAGPASSTAWGAWLVEQQTAQAAALPGVLSSTNPRVWTVAQSALYASPSLLATVESLHQLFAPIPLYDVAFSVLLMQKANLIPLLFSHTAVEERAPAGANPDGTALAATSAAALIDLLGHLDALVAVPENAGYKPFLQDVFSSLPPSALRAAEPAPSSELGTPSAASGAATAPPARQVASDEVPS